MSSRHRGRQRPDHGRSSARERQQRDRPALREALECAACGRRLGGAVEDHRALLVVVLERVEAERRADRGARAVGGNDELRAQLALFAGLLDRSGDVPLIAFHAQDFRRRERREPRRAAQPLPEHTSQRLVLDRVAERRHALLGGGNPRGAEPATLGDVNRANGLGIALELRPEAQAREDLLRAVRERRDARIEAGLLEQAHLLRFDEHGVERQLRERAARAPTPQRHRRRSARRSRGAQARSRGARHVPLDLGHGGRQVRSSARRGHRASRARRPRSGCRCRASACRRSCRRAAHRCQARSS